MIPLGAIVVAARQPRDAVGRLMLAVVTGPIAIFARSVSPWLREAVE